MFRRLPDAGGDTVVLSVDGKTLTARAGDSVAAALLAAGLLVCRTSAVSGAPRAPYCLMGVCFECLLAIDGRQNRQACLVEVADGMRIETQAGKREVGR
jgi:D-hydroxyproline dehydrogenase subunit gamma